MVLFNRQPNSNSSTTPSGPKAVTHRQAAANGISDTHSAGSADETTDMVAKRPAANTGTCKLLLLLVTLLWLYTRYSEWCVNKLAMSLHVYYAFLCTVNILCNSSYVLNISHILFLSAVIHLL